VNDVNKLEMEFLASIVSVITVETFSYKIYTLFILVICTTS